MVQTGEQPHGTGGAGPRHTTSRRSEAVAQIKEYILTNGLHPGDALPTEADLCSTLGVSRSSVREAVRTLSTLGIVEVRHGHGTFVGQMSLDALVETMVFRGALRPGSDLRALQEVIEIRQALDLAMAESLVTAVAGTTNPELWQLVDDMISASQGGSTFPDQDRAFHTALWAKMENSIIAPLVGAFWDIHTAVMPRLGVTLPADLTQTARAHSEMLAAAEAGDAEKYAAAVVCHYEPLKRSIAAGARQAAPHERR